MRVLASVRPYVGHLQPILPLLDDLRQAHHAVAVATAADLALDVESAGLGWCEAGLHPRAVQQLWPDQDPNYGVAAIQAKLDGLLAAADGVQPDLVIRDATDLAGALAAELLGLPCVTYSVCHYLPRRVWRRLAGRSIRELRRAAGLRSLRSPVSALDGAMYVDFMPPALQAAEVAEIAAAAGSAAAGGTIRYCAVRWEAGALPARAGGQAAATRLPAPTGRRVLVSFGTEFNDSARLWRAAVGGALAAADEVVATGVRDAGMLPGAGDRLHIAAGFVPHGSLLGGCAAIVCHGGFNTVLGAVAAGVPLVCLPIAGDQHYNAQIVERLGLGVRLTRRQAGTTSVTSAVARVTNEPSYAAAVARVRGELQQLPPARSLVRELTTLATGGASAG